MEGPRVSWTAEGKGGAYIRRLTMDMQVGSSPEMVPPFCKAVGSLQNTNITGTCLWLQTVFEHIIGERAGEAAVVLGGRLGLPTSRGMPRRSNGI